MERIKIVNARIVNEHRILEGDLLVSAGRIERIGGDLTALPADVVLDAQGNILMPGWIDDQVHFREPGLTHKADIFSETRAAVAGGITSYMEMPNTLPATTSLEALEAKFALAARKSLANHSFYLGATNDNLQEVRRLNPLHSCGIKVFMGSSTGNMLVDDRPTLERIFSGAPALIAAHCEDTPMIRENERRFRQAYGDDVPFRMHPKIRSAEACYASSSMAVELAKKHGAQLHVLHISTEGELDLFSSDALRNKHITAEACVHHLVFSDEDYDRLGSRIKCNPAIKTRADRAALRQALVDGTIDVIATDHAPHTIEEKAKGYFEAPSGLPLVQQALPALLELFHDGILSLELIAEKCAHAPADLFQVRERGYVREGYWADLIIVDIDGVPGDDEPVIHYKCGWTPFAGRRFRSEILTTLVSGEIAYHESTINDGVRGRRLEFDRQPA